MPPKISSKPSRMAAKLPALIPLVGRGALGLAGEMAPGFVENIVPGVVGTSVGEAAGAGDVVASPAGAGDGGALPAGAGEVTADPEPGGTAPETPPLPEPGIWPVSAPEPAPAP